jgi:hypothetical protein
MNQKSSLREEPQFVPDRERLRSGSGGMEVNGANKRVLAQYDKTTSKSDCPHQSASQNARHPRGGSDA